MTLAESRKRWWAEELRQSEGRVLLEVHALAKEIREHGEQVDRMIARGRRRRLGPSREELEIDAFCRGMRQLTRLIRGNLR
jgi:hypothetical protein